MMKKRGAITNILGFLLAAITIFAGITIPCILLDKQEKESIGIARQNKSNSFVLQNLEIKDGNSTAMAAPATSPVPNALTSGMSVDELYAHLYVWNMDGYNTYREPFEDELNMEQAVEKTRTCIGKFIQSGALPPISWNDFRLSDARLSANVVPLAPDEIYKEIGGIVVPSSIGRWILAFENKDEDCEITAICDAITGAIYELNVRNLEAISSINKLEILNRFASYYGLTNNSQEDGSNQVMSDRFAVTYARIDSNSFGVSINLKN